jgi:hypothetical protein
MRLLIRTDAVWSGEMRTYSSPNPNVPAYSVVTVALKTHDIFGRYRYSRDSQFRDTFSFVTHALDRFNLT